MDVKEPTNPKYLQANGEHKNFFKEAGWTTPQKIMLKCGIKHNTTFQRAAKRLGLIPSLPHMSMLNRKNKVYQSYSATRFVIDYREWIAGGEEKMTLADLSQLHHSFVSKMLTRLVHVDKEITDFHNRSHVIMQLYTRIDKLEGKMVPQCEYDKLKNRLVLLESIVLDGCPKPNPDPSKPLSSATPEEILNGG